VIVLDASVVVELLLQTDGAAAISRRLFRSRDTFHAPHLLDVEVTQVVRRYVVRGEITADHGRAMLDVLEDLPLTRYPHPPLLARIWELRHNLTAYDAVYVALAEGLRAPLLTRDEGLAATTGLRAAIELI